VSGSEAIEKRARTLFGEVDWSAAGGVIHVVAIAEAPRVVLAIGAHSPVSATDRFVLGFVRARSDAIVTTGAILRSEPELVHRFSEDPDEEQALADWRLLTLGGSSAPELIVLSRSGELSAAHPAIRFASSGFVWTSERGRARLGARLGALEVVVADQTGVAGSGTNVARALAFARSRSGIETLALEAGPNTAHRLYLRSEELDVEGDREGSGNSKEVLGPGVDELILSRFGGRLDPRAIGPRFIAQEQIDALFSQPLSEVRVEEASGPWRFERYRRCE
jgi:riboflavin biosynthesis pyrimidine reductase